MNDRVLDALRTQIGASRVDASPAALIAYSFDGTFQQSRPDVVASPESTDQVAAVVKIASRERIPLIPRGAGSGLAGGSVPVSGGIVVNLARMNRIVEIDTANTCAMVEAGVVTLDLQEAVERVGLFYPPDPASSRQSTIGGNVATNAGGPHCLKYGTTKDYVIGLTVVLPSGVTLRLGRKVSKNATGYQLMQLFVGSEGTLGIVTEAIVRLIPLPKARVTAQSVFRDVSEAGNAVSAIMADGLLPATLELMDATALRVVAEAGHVAIPRDAGAMLIIEQDASTEEAAHQEIARIAEICKSAGAIETLVAKTSSERDRLWELRRAVSPALARVRPNKLGEDIVVPKAAIPAMVAAIKGISEAHGLPIPVFGHAGDGNLHPNILFDVRDADEVRRVGLAAQEIFRAAMRLGGTITGEHGIGTLKREFLEEDLGADAIQLSRRIKDVIDPFGLMNPGKVFPSGRGTADFIARLPSLASPRRGLT